jgi:hypothetical protein
MRFLIKLKKPFGLDWKARITTAGRHATNGFYGEEAFRSLIDRESKRSERSGHLCRILLVHRSNANDCIVSMEPHIAQKTLVVLSKTLRDTDYVGWFRQERIVGAVLTSVRGDPQADECDGLETRLLKVLGAELVHEVSQSVQIEICRHQDIKKFEQL